ncbi:hypothetical protein SKAU_G00172900 [Synaphobranchus kaupii]|uniref:Uncharacterized protein n=1 Tax=Synaphobranchus kaupii TaxID=118154 RepID=A0A9Q1J0W1_SYNKA|nr:hypothetical protein SKAU_G00172900 [Synaphobranchus kaupii]
MPSFSHRERGRIRIEAGPFTVQRSGLPDNSRSLDSGPSGARALEEKWLFSGGRGTCTIAPRAHGPLQPAGWRQAAHWPPLLSDGSSGTAASAPTAQRESPILSGPLSSSPPTGRPATPGSTASIRPLWLHTKAGHAGEPGQYWF